MKYIEFDDSELLHSDFDDKTLQLVAELMGPEIRDLLLVPLVPVVDNVRFSSRTDKHAI